MQAEDMASDQRHQVLYVADSKKQVIHCVKLGSSDHGQWTVGQKPCGLSVAFDSGNLLVSCGETRRLVEFSPKGNILRNFPICGVVAVYHAITLQGGQVVASVGVGKQDPPLYRVCYIDSDGKKGHGFSANLPGFTLVGPGHLAAVVGDENSGQVLVGDCNGPRVVLLSTALTSMRVVATRNHGLRRVGRLSLDPITRRFYVADNAPGEGDCGGGSRSGRVMVFSL